MNKLIFPLLMIFLAGCPNEKEVKEIVDDIAHKREKAVRVISTQDYSVEGLLHAQDYFFDFSEKVHLMKTDAKSLENIKSLIRNNGMKKFCEKFIVSINLWNDLENYCNASAIYRCSPDIHAYQNTQIRFLEYIGTELKQQFQKEPSCY